MAGRAENKKEVTMTVRLTREEKAEVEQCARLLGQSNTETVVMGIHLVKEVIERHRDRLAAAGIYKKD